MWFIFAGDLLVMLFMVLLVIWVFMVSDDRDIDSTALIPLNDEDYGSGKTGNPVIDSKEQTGGEHG